MPTASGLVIKTKYNINISEIENKITDHNLDKYIATQEFHRLTTENVKARLKQADLVTKTDFDTQLKTISDRVTSNKSKHLLVETELKKLQKFDSSYFRGKIYLEGNYLIHRPMNRYFKKIGNTKKISSWKSKGLSDEVLKHPINNNSPASKLEHVSEKMFLKFDGSCLIKQD